MGWWLVPVALGAAALGFLGVEAIHKKPEEELAPPGTGPSTTPPTTAPTLPVLPRHQLPAPLPQNPGHLVNHVAQNGVARHAAEELYHHLKLSGIDAPAKPLIVAFQKATASDPQAVAISGPVPVTGVYDGRTSAALTMYTRDPIPPAADAPPMATPSRADAANAAIPGRASLAGFNLLAYLLAHGDNDTADEYRLVFEFQRSVNLDPKYPGPANQTGAPTIVKSKLDTSGKYNEATAAALRVITGTLIPPGASNVASKKIHAAAKARTTAPVVATHDAPAGRRSDGGNANVEFHGDFGIGTIIPSQYRKPQPGVTHTFSVQELDAATQNPVGPSYSVAMPDAGSAAAYAATKWFGGTGANKIAGDPLRSDTPGAFEVIGTSRVIYVG